jgi:uncharacterized surface protein with fasciclin (FAS1) repeats
MCLFCKQLSHTSPHDTAAVSQTAAPATPTSSTPRNPLKFAGNAIGMEKRWVVLIELYVLLQMFCLTHHTHHCCWAAAPSPRHDNDRLLIAHSWRQEQRWAIVYLQWETELNIILHYHVATSKNTAANNFTKLREEMGKICNMFNN